MGEGAIVMGWLSRIGKQAAKDADLVPAKNKLVGGTPEARLRAIEQGFDVDTPWFHAGNLGDELSADAGELGLHIGNQDAARLVQQRGVTRKIKPEVSTLVVRGNFAQTPDLGNFRSPYMYLNKRAGDARAFDPRYAEMWKDLDEVAQSIPKISAPNSPELPKALKQWRDKVHDAAKRNKIAGWEYENNAEGGGDPSRVVFFGDAVRKTDAAFDPSQSGSSKLLAAVPAAIGGGLLSRWAMMQNGDQYT